MKDYKKSITVPGGGVNALEDRVFQSTVITDIKYDDNDNAVIFNVGSKMAITFSSTDIRVGIGQALIDGCIFDNDVISIITPDRPTSGTAKAYICMTVDLDGTTGQKQYYEDVLGDAANFPTLVQDSLVEMTGGMKQIPIASFVIDSNGFITEVVDLTAALLHTTKEPVYSVDGVLPDPNGNVNVKQRVLDFGDIGVTDAEVTACTTIEEVCALIQSHITTYIGTSTPIIVRQTVWDIEPNFPKIPQLFEEKLASLTEWGNKTILGIDITFDTSMYTSNRFCVDVTFKLLGKPGVSSGYTSAYTQIGEDYHFSYADGVGINWEQMTNEKGLRFDFIPWTQAELSVTDFGANLKLMATELYNKKSPSLYKTITYGETDANQGNLQKSFIAYMNTQNAKWNMSWYTSAVQLGYEISFPSNYTPSGAEFEVKVKVLDSDKEYNFRCEGDYTGVIKPNYTTNQKGETQDLANEKRKLNDRDIGYDDFEHSNTLLKDVLFDIFSKGQNYVGYKSPFEVGFLCSANGTNYSPNIANKLISLISTKYGTTIPTAEFLNFKFEVITANGTTNPSYNDSNLVTIWNSNHYFTFVFDYEAFDNVVVKDINRVPHADLIAGIGKYMRTDHGTNIDVPFRDYISGVTFWIADFDSETNKWSYSDSNVHYVPRIKTFSAPASVVNGAPADTLFDPYHSTVTNVVSPNNPVLITSIASMYFGLNYASEEHSAPNGITITGSLTTNNNDQVLGMVVIHYGNKNWLDDNDKLKTAPIYSFTPTLLADLMQPEIEQPNIEPEAGTND